MTGTNAPFRLRKRCESKRTTLNLFPFLSILSSLNCYFVAWCIKCIEEWICRPTDWLYRLTDWICRKFNYDIKNALFFDTEQPGNQ